MFWREKKCIAISWAIFNREHDDLPLDIAHKAFPLQDQRRHMRSLLHTQIACIFWSSGWGMDLASPDMSTILGTSETLYFSPGRLGFHLSDFEIPLG